MKEFELQNVMKYVKSISGKYREEDIFVGLKHAIEKDGYHSFNERDMVMLLVLKLEMVKPERMLASTMLREIGVLNIYSTDNSDILHKVLAYCVSVILWL